MPNREKSISLKSAAQLAYIDSVALTIDNNLRDLAVVYEGNIYQNP